MAGPLLALGVPLLQLALQGLKMAGTAQARKYHEKLYKLNLELIEIEALPPEEVDDVEYVTLLKTIVATAKAAHDDPATFSKESDSNPPSA